MADEQIVVKSKIDTSGFTNDAKKLIDASKKSAESLRKIGERAKEVSANLSRVNIESANAFASKKAGDITRQLAEQSKELGNIAAKYKEMTTDKADFDAFNSMGLELENIEHEIDVIMKKRKSLANIGGTNSSMYKDDELKQLIHRLVEVQKKQDLVEAGWERYRHLDLSEIESQLKSQVESMQEIVKEANSLEASETNRINNAIAENERQEQSVGSIAEAYRNYAEAMKMTHGQEKNYYADELEKTKQKIEESETALKSLEREQQIALATHGESSSDFIALTNRVNAAKQEISELKLRTDGLKAAIKGVKGDGLLDIAKKSKIARSAGTNLKNSLTGFVKSSFTGSFGQLKNGFSNLAGSAKTAAQAFIVAKNPFRAIGDTMTNMGAKAVNLAGKFGSMINPVNIVKNGINALLHPMQTFKTVSGYAKQGLDLLRTGAQKILAPFTGFKARVEKAVVALGKIKAAASKVVATFNRMKGAVNKVKSAFSKLGRSAQVAESGFKRNFRTLMRYTLGIRSTFILIRKLRSAIKEGFSNLAGVDSELSAQITNCQNALAGLKNSLAAAFAPIVKIVIPYVTMAINYLNAFLNKIGQVIAALTGSKTYTKAVVGTAGALSDEADAASDAAEATNDYLSGLDEVNKFTDDSSSSSGADSGSGGLADAFETADIDSAFSEWADKLKEMWENADFTELGEKLTHTVAEALEKIPWDTVQEYAARAGKSTGTFINGVFGSPEDWAIIGNAIGETINTVLIYYDELFKVLNFDQIGASLAAGIDAMVEAVDFERLGRVAARMMTWGLELIANIADSLDWENLGAKMAQGINSFASTIADTFERIDFKDIATKIFNGLNKMIEDINAAEIGRALSDMINSVIDTLVGAVETFDWIGFGSKFGAIVRETLSNVKWDELGKALVDGATGMLLAFTIFFSEFNWEEAGTNLMNGIAGIFENINWDLIKAALLINIKNITDFIGSAFSNEEAISTIAEGVGAALDVIMDCVLAFFSTDTLSTIAQGAAEFINNLGSNFDAEKFGTVVAKINGAGRKMIETFLTSLNFEELGGKLSEAINSVFGKMRDSWANKNYGEIGAKIAEGLGKAILSIEWETIGAFFAEKFNQYVDFVGAIASYFATNASTMASEMVSGLNTFVSTIDWEGLGGTIRDLLNGAISFLYTAVTEFDFVALGTNLGTFLSTAINGVNWGELGATIGEAIKGVLNFLTSALTEFDWNALGKNISDFMLNIDWLGLLGSLGDLIVSACIAVIKLAVGESQEVFSTIMSGLGDMTWQGFLQGLVDATVGLATWIKEHIIDPFVDCFKELLGIHSPSTVTAEIGEFTWKGFLQGIINAISGIAAWLKENVFDPFIDCFKELFGIGTDSSVMADVGTTLISGLLRGITETWNTITGFFSGCWSTITTTVSTAWTTISTTVKTAASGVWSTVSEKWTSISTTTKEKWESVKTDITTKFESIKTITATKLETMKTKLSTGWSNIKTTASTAWEGIKNTIASIDWAGLGTNIINGIFGAMNNIADKVSEFASGFLGKVKSALGINSPSTLFRDEVGVYVGEGISEGMNNSNAEGAATNLASNMTKGFQNASSDSVSTWENAATSMGNTFNNIGTKSKKTTDDIESGYKKAAKSAMSAFSDADFTKATKGLVESTESSLKQVTKDHESAAQKAVDAWYATNSKFQESNKAVVSAFKSLPNDIKEIFKNAFNYAVDAWSQSRAKFNQVVTNITEAFKNFPNTMKECFTNAFKNATEAWSTAKTKFSAICAEIVSSFEKFPNDMKECFSNAFDNVKQAWNTANNDFSETANGIVNAFAEVPNLLRARFEEAYNNVRMAWSTSNGDFETTSNMIVNAFSNLPNYINEIFTNAYAYARNAWANAYYDFANVANAIVQAFGNVPSEFQSIFSNAQSLVMGMDWNYVGYHCVTGMINGMYEANNNISEWASDFLQAVRDELGIASPSRVFRDEVGRWLGEGIGVGLSDSENQLLSTVREIAYDIADVFDSAIDRLGFEIPVTSSFDGFDFSQPVLSTGTVLPTYATTLVNKAEDLVDALQMLISQLSNVQYQQQTGPNGSNQYNVSVNVDGRSLFNFVIDEAVIARNQSGINPLLLGG